MPAANNTLTPAEIKTRILALMDDILATGCTGAFNDHPEICAAYDCLVQAYRKANNGSSDREVA